MDYELMWDKLKEDLESKVACFEVYKARTHLSTKRDAEVYTREILEQMNHLEDCDPKPETYENNWHDIPKLETYKVCKINDTYTIEIEDMKFNKVNYYTIRIINTIDNRTEFIYLIDNSKNDVTEEIIKNTTIAVLDDMNKIDKPKIAKIISIQGLPNPKLQEDLLDEKNKKESQDNKYKVITLCGSTKFKDEFIKAQKDLTLAGNIVISVGMFGHSGDDETWNDRVKEMLDDIHKKKIDMADEILVINKDNYIGESTKSEILYAFSKGKKINYLYNYDEE